MKITPRYLDRAECASLKVVSFLARPHLRRDNIDWQTKHVILAAPQMLRAGISMESCSLGFRDGQVKGGLHVKVTCA